MPLRMRLIHTPNMKWGDFYEKMKYAEAVFSMFDEESRRFIVANRTAEIVEYIPKTSRDNKSQYYIQYCFRKKDLGMAGYYRGEFGIRFTDCGTELHVPTSEKLYINVLDTITRFIP